MREQRLYHWGSYMLPGIIFNGFIIILFLIFYNLKTTDLFINLDILIQSNLWFITLLILYGFISYLAGMLLWGLAYSDERYALFYPSKGYNKWGEYEKSLKPQYLERLESFSKTYKALDKYYYNPTNDTNNTNNKYNYDDYKQFQEKMFLATELFKTYLGPRITSQWESLGLLLTISLTFRIMAIICLCFCFICSIKFIVAFVIFILLSFISIIGYRYRNKNLGRDVAYFVHLFNTKNYNLKRKE